MSKIEYDYIQMSLEKWTRMQEENSSLKHELELARNGMIIPHEQVTIANFKVEIQSLKARLKEATEIIKNIEAGQDCDYCASCHIFISEKPISGKNYSHHNDCRLANFLKGEKE